MLHKKAVDHVLLFEVISDAVAAHVDHVVGLEAHGLQKGWPEDNLAACEVPKETCLVSRSS